MVKKYSELYLDARRQLLAQMDEPDAANCARQLLMAASGKSMEAIVTDRNIYASEEIEQKLTDSVRRILSDEPLAYVLGEWDFYGMTLRVTPDVLIPRDDTAAVTELAIEHAIGLRREPRILDLCAGSGCIGLALARQIKNARVVLGELSPAALRVAKSNVAGQKLSGRITCMAVDAMQPAMPFLGKFDMIVSNPPYVTTAEMDTLPRSVKEFEPHMALHGGEDGLDFYRAIAANFTHALGPDGLLCLEFGMGQENGVARILQQAGYEIVQWKQDASQIIRAVCARKRG